MERKSIGTFIAVLRKSSGMTQKDLADRLGVSDKTLSNWERDENAPDLLLIPVIAEIFGVTCDELLRGERKKDIPDAGETEKQAKYLNSSRERFMARSIVPLILSVLGLLAAFICKFAFNLTDLGFITGCILYASAIICETLFVSHAFSAAGDDFDETKLNDYKIYVVRLAGKVFSFPVIMFAASLPLVIAAAAWGWGLILLFSAAAAVICLFAVYLVNNALIKKGVYTLSKITDIKRHKTDRLKVMCTAIAALILCAISAGQTVFNNTVWPVTISTGETGKDLINFGFNALCYITIGAGFLVYFRKRAKLA